MKLHKIMILCACTSIIVCSCSQGSAVSDAAHQERDSLQRIIDEKDAELDDIMGTFNEVQEGIRRISEAEGRVTVADATRENASSRELIRENLEFIEQAMKQNRDMVAQLKEKLRNSSIKADKLQKTIANLQNQIEQQAQRIQELEASLAEKDEELIRKGQEISELNDNVTSLEADNESKSKSLAAQVIPSSGTVRNILPPKLTITHCPTRIMAITSSSPLSSLNPENTPREEAKVLALKRFHHCIITNMVKNTVSSLTPTPPRRSMNKSTRKLHRVCPHQ